MKFFSEEELLKNAKGKQEPVCLCLPKKLGYYKDIPCPIHGEKKISKFRLLGLNNFENLVLLGEKVNEIIERIND